MHSAVGTGRLVAGRYRLLDQLGRGAMGIVWRGRDELLDREVAIKQIVLTPLASETEARSSYERTLREARTAARLSHPGVVTVFDVVEEDSSPWIVMELIRARPLDQVIAEDGPLPPSRAAQLGLGLLDALSTAHKAGVLHRDVKPSNVLIKPNGKAVLTDFGIATIQGDPGLTQAGMVVGTPGFSPPERVRGVAATPASDLWSLGATLYAAVEGRGPFDRAGGSAAIVASIATEPAPRAPSAGPLAPVIDALLRADPSERPDAAATGRLLTQAWKQARVAERVPLGGPMAAGAVDSAGAAGASGVAAGVSGVAADGPAAGGGPGGSEFTTATQVVTVPEEPGLAAASAAGLASGSGQAGLELDEELAALDADASTVSALPARAQASAATGVVPDLMATPNFADLKMPELGQGTELGPSEAGLVIGGADGTDEVGVGELAATGPSKAKGSGGAGGSGSGAAAASGASGRPSAAGFFRSRRAAVILAPLLVIAIAGVVIHFAFPNVSSALGRFGGSITGQDRVSEGLNHGGKGGTNGGHAPAGGRSGSHGSSGHSSAPGNPNPSPRSSGSGKPKPTPSGKHSSSGKPKPSPTGKHSSSGRPSSSPRPTHSTSPTPSPSPSPTPSKSKSTGGTPPPGYVWDQVSASEAGTLAGFKLAGPQSWVMTPGLNTIIKAASGPGKLDVNMTTWAVKSPVRQARQLQATARANRKYRQYHLVTIAATKFDGWPAARWTFWWQPKAGGQIIDVTILLFTAQTWEGPQQYAMSISAPDPRASWALSIFQVAKSTFKPLPG